MDLEKIAKLIKTKRKEKGLTQEELARKINVTEKAISRWETGRGTPDIALLIPLSKELGVSVSEILSGKEDVKENQNFTEIVHYIDETKKNKNKHIITISSIIYIMLLLLYLWYLRVDYNVSSSHHLTFLAEVIYNAFFISAVFLNNRFIANNYYDSLEDRERMNRISYIMISIIYLIMLFNLTIYARYLDGFSYNLIPFKTILECFSNHTFYTIAVNILGNIIIMMPIEFFLIKIFDLNEYKKCFLISFTFVFIIEIIQFISHTGVFDIDDIILNLIGMSVMYKLTLGKHHFLNRYKYFIITSIFSSIIVYFLFVNLSFYDIGRDGSFVVIVKLIISYLVIEGIFYGILKIVKKKDTK